MYLIDLIQSAVQAQVACLPNQMCTVSCLDQRAVCPASAFNAVAAAFATEGYWVQDHLIHFLVDTGMGLWAPLLYILAAVGGLTSLAMGAPPRMYMWFFLGPALYAWLLDTRELASGVEWRVGDMPQDQREVWKMAEAGLRNSDTFHDVGWIHTNVRIYKNKPPGGDSLPPIDGRYGQPGMYANVASFFLWFDELISDTVQQMTRWVGAFNQTDNRLVGAETGLIRKPNTPDLNRDKWYLLSNHKWEMLTNITDAKAHSAELRDAWVTFLSSECGDLLKRSIDSARLIAVSNAKGQNIDYGTTIMLKDQTGDPYNFVTQILMSQTIPTPRSLVKLLSDDSRGSFRNFANLLGTGGLMGASVGAWGIRERVACDQYLFLLIHAFRWESGHTTNQIIAAGPHRILPSGMVWALFYGWDLRDWSNLSGNPTPGLPLDYQGQIKFLENMVLIHMIRNELAMAPALTDQRYATAEKSLNYTLAYQRSVGQKGKWAEVYTWATMIPYLQGVLLYLLAIAYPFACIVILIPGMHKSILTWMSFWAWVKLWDLGFAIVVVLERSVWAMIGNNANASRLLGLVEQMSDWGYMQIDCTGAGSGLPNGVTAGVIPTGGDQIAACPLPRILHVASTGTVGDIQSQGAWLDAIRIFDRSLVLGANLDFDLANSYYIYIMAALYFAVPTVTGQLVLGARAGAAGMVNTALGGVSQESGKMAGSGYGSEAVTQMHANMASVGQAAYAKSLRQSGLGMQAIEYGNQAARESDAASAMGTRSQTIGEASDSKQRGAQLASSVASTVNTYGNALQGIYNSGSDIHAGKLDAQAKAAQRQQDRAERAAERGNGRSPSSGAAVPPGPAPSDREWGSAGAGGNKLAMGDSPGGGGNFSPPTPAVNMSGGGGVPGPVDPGTAAAGAGLAGLTGEASRVGGPNSGVSRLGSMGQGAIRNGNQLVAVGMSDWVMGKTMEAQTFASNANAAKADLAIGSFGASARSRGYEMAGSRMGAHAGFEAQQAEWEAKNQFANQITGQAVAMGHFVGGMSAGNKPTSSAEAMAMSGMLNTSRQDAKGAAFWSDPIRGQRFGNIQGTEGRLSREGGGDFVAAQFQQYGFGFSSGGIVSRSGTEVRNESNNPFRGNQVGPIAQQQR